MSRGRHQISNPDLIVKANSFCLPVLLPFPLTSQKPIPRRQAPKFAPLTQVFLLRLIDALINAHLQAPPFGKTHACISHSSMFPYSYSRGRHLIMCSLSECSFSTSSNSNLPFFCYTIYAFPQNCISGTVSGQAWAVLTCTTGCLTCLVSLLWVGSQQLILLLISEASVYCPGIMMPLPFSGLEVARYPI